MITLAVVADTHIPRRAPDLPRGAWRHVDSAGAVLHAGDVTSSDFLRRLGERTVLHAVRGNNDLELAGLPETRTVEVEGVKVAMVHDSGPSTGRRQRLRQQYPEARVVVFGHSHIPLLDDDGSLLLLNPGSPTDRRRMPTFTMALLHLDNGEARAEIADLGLERAAR